MATMKSLIQFLSQKWIISLIGILALLGLIWFGGPYLGIGDSQPLASPFNRLLAILILVVLWGGNNFRLRLKATQANDQMIDTLVTAPTVAEEAPIEKVAPGYGRDFKEAANGLRGVTAWVEREGTLRLGDAITLHIPDQRPWAGNEPPPA